MQIVCGRRSWEGPGIPMLGREAHWESGQSGGQHTISMWGPAKTSCPASITKCPAESSSAIEVAHTALGQRCTPNTIHHKNDLIWDRERRAICTQMGWLWELNRWGGGFPTNFLGRTTLFLLFLSGDF
ncbi:UNVERIFIED_CONTAM: hypothetical protein K2H54_041108 [Gekko kuhli]